MLTETHNIEERIIETQSAPIHLQKSLMIWV
jgi:hypothetical protein